MKTNESIVKRRIIDLGKIFFGGICFYGGIILGSILASAFGMESPSLPPGVDEATLSAYMLISSVLIAAVLAMISHRLETGFLLKWLILSVFAWITLGINTGLEAAVFVPSQASFGFIVIIYGLASFTCGGAIAWMYPSRKEHQYFHRLFHAFRTSYPLTNWLWRLIAAVTAFPIIYIIFGLMVEPIVVDYYVEQVAGLQLPTWEELIPVLLLRSTLFLIACLPLLIAWHRSRTSLLLTLGFALFMFVGGVYMLQSYWLPLSLRIPHTLEILVSSFVYTGVLVLLFRSRNVHNQLVRKENGQFRSTIVSP